MLHYCDQPRAEKEERKGLGDDNNRSHSRESQ